ncbi:hypothetical protein [Roseateles asaccharophilus]|uniref:hypothetical protein n=1 Tax=Roseateles asaccharophilus TaxID=582607 RepID=UPI00384C067A
MKRLTVLSGPTEASVDIRKACNGIKRAASLGAAALLTELDPKAAVEAAEVMAVDVLRGIGFDVDDRERVDAVMPMVLEACCLVLADAARRAEPGQIRAALDKVAGAGVKTLVEVAKSRPVAKMIEPVYPVDMDSMVALRLTAASALAQVSVEVMEFDFGKSAAACIGEAAKTVVKSALDAAQTLAPSQSSKAAQLMLTQSLIHSAAKVYGATWRAIAQETLRNFDALSDAEYEAKVQAMEVATIAVLVRPINERFSDAFQAVVGAAKAIFDAPSLPVPASSPAAPARRPGARPR